MDIPISLCANTIPKYSIKTKIRLMNVVLNSMKTQPMINYNLIIVAHPFYAATKECFLLFQRCVQIHILS